MSTRREVLIAGGLSALSAVASAAEPAPDEKKCTAHRPLRRKARELTLLFGNTCLGAGYALFGRRVF